MTRMSFVRSVSISLACLCSLGAASAKGIMLPNWSPKGFAEAPAAPPSSRNCDGTLVQLRSAQQIPGSEICMRKAFVRDNLELILYHELGHALVQAYDLAAYGEEENVADDFATVIVASNRNDPQRFNKLMSRAIFKLQSAYDDERNGRSIGTRDYWDEHSVDRKRAAQIQCLIAGTIRMYQGNLPTAQQSSWERAYSQLGLNEQNKRDVRLLTRCQGRAEKNTLNWLANLKGIFFGISETWHAQNDLRVDEVSYIDPEDPALVPVQKELQNENLLEWLQGDINESHLFKSKHLTKLALKAMQCDTANAWFSPDEESITLCYEYVQMIEAIHNEIESTVSNGPKIIMDFR